MIREHKGYLISPFKQVPNVYKVSVAGKGGSIADTLKGVFTNHTFAMQAIDNYLGDASTIEEKVDADKARVSRRGK